MWKGYCLILPLCPWGHAVVWRIKQEPTNWYKVASFVSSQLVVRPHSGENVEGPVRSLEASQRVSQPTGLPAATFTLMLPASVFPATHPASEILSLPKSWACRRRGTVSSPHLVAVIPRSATWLGNLVGLGILTWALLREVYPRRSVTLSLVCLFSITFPPLTLKGKIHSDDRKIW